MRSFDRNADQTRPIKIDMGFTGNADGSILISFGNTRVICTAFMEEKVPGFLRNQRKGWVTAEYGMLPGSTHTRSTREAAKGKQSGRTVEISRLIGRSLRTCVDMGFLGERTITIDCDVIQADGGTRTTSITGGYLALVLCLWKHREKFDNWPLVGGVSAVSLGILNGEVLVDLDYKEDFAAEVDLNLVMNHQGKLVEIQGTAEEAPFTVNELMDIVKKGSDAIGEIQRQCRRLLLEEGVIESCIP